MQHDSAQAQAADPSDSSQGSQACVRSKHHLERNKHNAVAYYTMAFNDKDPRRAVELYGGDEYIQHNPLAPNGFDAFIAFVESFTTAFPDAHIEIKRVFAECDFVITHALATGAVPVYTEPVPSSSTSSASTPTARSSSTGTSRRPSRPHQRTATPRSEALA